MLFFRSAFILAALLLYLAAISKSTLHAEIPDTLAIYPDEVGAFAQFYAGESGEEMYSGGGVCIQQEPQFCWVLTADHVCQNEGSRRMMDIEGTEITFKIVHREPASDLCLVRAYHQFNSEMSRFVLQVPLYAEMYNFSSPLNHFRAGPDYLLPRFTGTFSGNYYVRDLGVVAMEISSGSSGSSVYFDGRIFGVIVERNLNFDEVTYLTNSIHTVAFIATAGLDDVTVEIYDNEEGWIEMNVQINYHEN